MVGEKRHLRYLGLGIVLWLALSPPVAASPWAEVGDDALRSDIQILAAAGVLDNLTSHWPLPWTAIAHQLETASLTGQSAIVREAADRVLVRAHSETADGWQAQSRTDLTNRPNVVYDFGGLGRADGETQAALTYNAQDFSGRLSLGAFSPTLSSSGTRFITDDSYAAVKLGDTLLYAGQITHWWGPGWISALSLSNNVEPFPQIGIERLDTSASSWPVLNWLGPWQAEFFVGLLNGPRIDKDTLYNGLRVTFNPAPGLQIGLARTQEFCGENHPCNPLKGYFDLNNDPGHPDTTANEGLIDVQYTTDIWGLPAEAYVSLMNEDSSPIVHSGTTHLFGASIWQPLAGNLVRVTLEYTDSVATRNIFSFGDVIYGYSYTDYKYLDGMHYYDRTLGFSLDTDSRLATLQAGWSDAAGRYYQITLNHAQISDPENPAGNVVTSAPVTITEGEGRFTIPLPWFKWDLALRLQSDQPRPERGFAASVESAFRFSF
jgi:Capsule assembly protein Wzi